MAVVTDTLLDSLSYLPPEDALIDGSFQSRYGESRFDYSDYGLDRLDHYGGHSRCHPGGILPLLSILILK